MASVLQTYRIALRRQVQVIVSLALREVRLRNSKYAFGYLIDVLEAIGFVIVMTFISLYVNRQIPVGDSTIVFVATGVLPILFFRSVSMKAAGGLKSSRGARSLHNVTVLDGALARAIVEAMTFIIVMVVLFVGCAIFGLSDYAIPFDALKVAEILLVLFVFALGLGLVTAVIAVFVPIWRLVWNVFARLQIFFCAVFYIPEYMDPTRRQLVEWNPMTHLVALFRSGFYPHYPRAFADVDFVLLCVGLSLLVGLALQRITENRMATI